jgi:hypothetical protein
MSKTSVQVWNFGDVDKIEIHKNGTINKNATRAYQNGQCHSLALAINKLVGWPIYGICDWSNTDDSPGHVVVRNPKNGGFVDIKGYGAVSRWRKKWGPVTVHPLTVEQTKNLDTYLRPSVIKAIPFAKKVLERIGYEY